MNLRKIAMSFSPTVQKIISQAALEAQKCGNSRLEPEHLLIAMSRMIYDKSSVDCFRNDMAFLEQFFAAGKLRPADLTTRLFEEMEQKRVKCFDWQVQIADCRYRPLTQTFDEYAPHKKDQTDGYYIHRKRGWSDALVKQFRRNVRRQNICVRHGFPLYSRKFDCY